MQHDHSHATFDDSASRNKYRACLPAFLGGIAALMALLLGGVIWLASHRIPQLTETAFHDARTRWQDRSVANYEIEIHVTGRQPATYRVVVNDGTPTTAERNGHVLPQERVWKTWSVDGMFATVHRDLVNEDRKTGQLLVRTEFDSVYGYPSRYMRVQLGQPTDVSWRVTRFVELDPSTLPSAP